MGQRKPILIPPLLARTPLAAKQRKRLRDRPGSRGWLVLVRGSTITSIDGQPAARLSLVNPVTLPPGRARLAVNPRATGSVMFASTTGMLRVSFKRAEAAAPWLVTITSGARLNNSATKARF